MSKNIFVEVIDDGEIKTVTMSKSEFECFNYGVEVGRAELTKELKDTETFEEDEDYTEEFENEYE